MNKQTFAQIWLLSLIVGIVGYTEYHMWLSLGVTQWLQAHGIVVAILLTWWSIVTLGQSDTDDRDIGW